MPYIERPDLAQEHTNAVNSTVYPNAFADIQDDFGVKEVPIYVYNISRMTFNESRPPNHGRMLIRPCPEGKPYLIVGGLTHPFREATEDQNGNKGIRLTNGYIEASKMLNPRNPGTDQDFDDATSLQVNGNLNLFGVFWSIHNPPLETELASARKRMENTYRKELEKMQSVEARNPEDARAMANDISHAAAHYFGVSTSWHNTNLIPKDQNAGKIDCGVCGEKIQPKAKLCVHCGAPTDPVKQEKWLQDRFEEKRGPGRPPMRG